MTVTLFQLVNCQSRRVSIFRELSRISIRKPTLTWCPPKKNDSISRLFEKFHIKHHLQTSRQTSVSSYVISTYDTSLTLPLGRALQLAGTAAFSVRRKFPSQLTLAIATSHVTTNPMDRNQGVQIC